MYRKKYTYMYRRATEWERKLDLRSASQHYTTLLHTDVTTEDQPEFRSFVSPAISLAQIKFVTLPFMVRLAEIRSNVSSKTLGRVFFSISAALFGLTHSVLWRGRVVADDDNNTTRCCIYLQLLYITHTHKLAR